MSKHSHLPQLFFVFVQVSLLKHVTQMVNMVTLHVEVVIVTMTLTFSAATQSIASLAGDSSPNVLKIDACMFCKVFILKCCLEMWLWFIKID